MPIIKSNFKTAWWLSNPHLQTLWPTLLRKRPVIALQNRRLELPDGDFIDLAHTQIDDKPIVVLLHGLEGSLHSHYIKPLIRMLDDAGYGVFFMHFRGCSGQPNRLARGYHSGETGDLQTLVEYLSSRYSQGVFAVAGFSLGGNVVLKWLGEQGERAAVTTAIAISVPFKLADAEDRLEKSVSRLYQSYLLSRCRKKYKEKFSTGALESPLGSIEIDKLKTFYQFDDQVTAPLHGFNGADDYYNQCSSRQFLRNIRKPTLIIHAKDDPFMWEQTVPDETELSNSVYLELSERGGHVGFVGGTLPFIPEYWLEQRIIKWLQTQDKHSINKVSIKRKK